MRQNEDKKRRDLFCILSARGYPPEEAIRRAGFPFEGDWTRQAAELLMLAAVRRRIAKYCRELSFCAPAVLARAGLERLALGGVEEAGSLLREDGVLPEGAPLLHVSEIKQGKGVLEVKFFDRLRALTALAELGDGEAAGANALLEALNQSARQQEPGEVDG